MLGASSGQRYIFATIYIHLHVVQCTQFQMGVLYCLTDEEEVVPQKFKKSVKQPEPKTSKEVVHVKER